MEILDRSHDHFHLIDQPGGYEWTYYDGFSGDGRTGFTAIWFRGVPMSPNYSAALQRSGRSGRPVEHSAFAFHLYHDRRTVASWLVEGNGEDLFSTDPDQGHRLGGGGLWLDRSVDGTLNARISVDGTSPVLRRHVRGEIDLSFPPVDLTQVAASGINRDLTDHYWVPAGPSGSFSADLDLSGRFSSPTRFRFSGEAYHDRNFGFSPLMNHKVDWIWGRLHSHGHTLIFFSIVPLRNERGSGRPHDLEISRALLFSDGNLLREANDLQLEFDSARHWATLSYPSQIRGGTGGNDRLRLLVSDPSRLESGPFYHRLIASIEAGWGEWSGAGSGTIEYFRPDRLGIRSFRPFIRTRVRRRSFEKFRK